MLTQGEESGATDYDYEEFINELDDPRYMAPAG